MTSYDNYGCGSIDCMAMPAIAAAAEQRASVTDSKHPGDPALIDLLGLGRETSAGEQVDEQTALTCTAVYAAVRVLAETVAFLPWKVYRRLPDGGKEEATGHPLYRLLHDAPNPEMSAYHFRESLQAHLATWGNAYAEIQRTRSGEIYALWPIEPDRVRAKRRNRQVVYDVSQPEGGQVTLTRREMFHVAGLGFDGLVGYSPIALQRETVGRSMGADRFAAETTSNNPAPSGFLEHPGTLSEKAQQRWNEAMKRRASQGNRHRVLLLEEGMKFAGSQLKPSDVQLIHTRRYNVEDVARMYRIAPSLLQDLTHGTFSNITELGRQFVIYTMNPWFGRWCSAANGQLLDSGEYFCEFSTNAFMAGDPKARSEFYRGLFGIGGMTINDILRKENMNPIGPEGDRRFVPLNMVPLDKLDEIYAADPPAAGDDDQVDDPADDEVDEDPDAADDEGDERQRAAWRVMRRICDRQYERLFSRAANVCLRRVRHAVDGPAERHLGRDILNFREFRAWLGEWTEKHRAYAREVWRPVIEAYAGTLAGVLGMQVGLEGEPSEAFAATVDRFAAEVADNHVEWLRRRLGREAEGGADAVIAAVRAVPVGTGWAKQVMSRLAALVSRQTAADAGGYDPDDPTLPGDEDERRGGWIDPPEPRDEVDDDTDDTDDEDQDDGD